MPSVNEIRAQFLDYFAANEHRVVASSPLVPRNDPTLMFTNAGMVQFKNVFTGAETRPYRRAATSQKCVRAGGKHNDLDNVGYTARHHTFFEMLGNFSFGDYFKERAIELAWRLVTKDYGLQEERLVVTVFAEDDEAHGLWRKIAGLPEERVIRIPTSDNFWAMGETGPCGPCSEIFYDHGPHVAGGPPGSADQDGDRFVEIWNLVFMQFEQVTPDERIDLPRPSIDTGMGLERIAAIMQGTSRQLRDRPVQEPDRRERRAERHAGGGRASRLPPGDGRSLAGERLPDRRWRDAVERGAGLCAPADHAARHAPRPTDGLHRAADVAPGADAGARDGPGFRRARARRAAHRRDSQVGRDPLQGDPGARPAPAGRRNLRPRRRRSAAGGDCVQALRYLRLPPRSHRGCATRPGTCGRARGLRGPAWSASARRRGVLGRARAMRRAMRSGSAFASASAQPSSWATARRAQRAWSRRW